MVSMGLRARLLDQAVPRAGAGWNEFPDAGMVSLFNRLNALLPEMLKAIVHFLELVG
jgi:hypothetical protein